MSFFTSKFSRIGSSKAISLVFDVFLFDFQLEGISDKLCCCLMRGVARRIDYIDQV
jgi:hypothetical protein